MGGLFLRLIVSAAFALAVPRPETEDVVDHLAFFQRVAAMIRKRLADESGENAKPRQRDVDAAVRQVIGGAVDAGEVIDLFAAAGLAEARIDILSDMDSRIVFRCVRIRRGSISAVFSEN